MPKGIYINNSEDLEIVNFKRVNEVIEEYDTEKIFDNLTICFNNNDDSENCITINDIEYALPALIKIKGKSNQYFLDMLMESLANFETEEIYLDGNDFYDRKSELDNESTYEEEDSVELENNDY